MQQFFGVQAMSCERLSRSREGKGRRPTALALARETAFSPLPSVNRLFSTEGTSDFPAIDALQAVVFPPAIGATSDESGRSSARFPC
jgi:hypothetical protein